MKSCSLLQLVLQIGIILTGNYNFFNLLTIALSLSLLDDEDLGYVKRNYTSAGFGIRFTQVTKEHCWTVAIFDALLNYFLEIPMN